MTGRLIVLLQLFYGTLFAQPGFLEIHSINVQQGDCVLIRGPNGTLVLVDAGNNGKGSEEVVPYLADIGITPTRGIDYMIATHMDADHIGGIDEVISAGYDVTQRCYDNGSTKSNTVVTEYRNSLLGTTGGAVVRILPGTTIDLGSGARILCVASGGDVLGMGYVGPAQLDENDMSVALLVEYGNFDYILAGDLGGGDDDLSCTGRSTSQSNIETSVARAITPDGPTPLLSAEGVDVLHVNHHGSESSTNSDYVNLLRPEVATINVGSGQGGTWHHPRKDVVEKVLHSTVDCVENLPVVAYQTEEGSPLGNKTSTQGFCVGDIVISTDGRSTFSISGTGAVSQGPNEVGAAGLPRIFQLDEQGAIQPPSSVLDHVIISEVFYDPEGSREGDREWIEFFNPTSAAVDLSGWQLIDDNGNGRIFTFPQHSMVPSSAFFVVARDEEGFRDAFNVDSDIAGLSLVLNNNGDAVVLRNGNIDVDAVAWEGGAGGGFPAGWGAGPSATEGTSIRRNMVDTDTDTSRDWLDDQVAGPKE